MDLSSFHQLLTPSGQAALDAAAALQPREADFLQLFTRLSKEYSPALARAALETAILRQEAVGKFPQAERMYFTREALEQASPQAVSAYRARRYQGFQRLVDLGCSIGGDTLALAELAPVGGIDLDPLRLALAQANLAALGLAHQALFVQADLLDGLPLASRPSVGLFFDPARRAQGRRVFSTADYLPPLERVLDWLPRFPALGVKISPGVQWDELLPYPAEVEFVSLNGEMKEAVLWFGPLRTARRRATLLPGEHTLEAGDDPSPSGELPLVEPQAYLYEPDAAVLRAGLVADLGRILGAAQLDADIAYLTAPEYQETPFARAWTVEAWFPFSLKGLRAELRARGVGRLTVKKRGSPLQPEALIRDLRLKGDAERTIFLTHLRGRPIVILAGQEMTRRG
jgi:SAM-dependent methyltransferase